MHGWPLLTLKWLWLFPSSILSSKHLRWEKMTVHAMDAFIIKRVVRYVRNINHSMCVNLAMVLDSRFKLRACSTCTASSWLDAPYRTQNARKKSLPFITSSLDDQPKGQMSEKRYYKRCSCFIVSGISTVKYWQRLIQIVDAKLKWWWKCIWKSL